jgi:hypothetical protein
MPMRLMALFYSARDRKSRKGWLVSMLASDGSGDPFG